MSKSLPADYYHHIDKDIFHDCWHYVCQTKQINPILKITVNQIPVVITKTESHYRAFYNVCSHKAAPLDIASSNKCLVCPYHGWTYDLDGNLKVSPECHDLSKEEYGLRSIKLIVHNDAVFICFGFSEYWNFPANFNYSGFELDSVSTYILNCNWKVAVDNYLDGGYHVNYVHQKLGSVIDYKEYKTIIYDKSVLQEAPLTTGDKDVEAVRSGKKAQYWWFWPNLMFNIYENSMDINTIYQLNNNQCLVTLYFFYKPDSDYGFRYKSTAMANAVQIEDNEICEKVQIGLDTGVYQSGPYGDREQAVKYFHKLIKKVI